MVRRSKTRTWRLEPFSQSIFFGAAFVHILTHEGGKTQSDRKSDMGDSSAGRASNFQLGLVLGCASGWGVSLAVALLVRFASLKGGLFLEISLEGGLCAALLAWLSVQPWATDLLRKRDGGDGLPSPEATFSLIRKRRSIFLKDFNNKTVVPGYVSTLLEAANWAPTHGKTEPWRFVVLSGEGKNAMTRLTIEHTQKDLDIDAETRSKKLAKFAKKQLQWEKASYMIGIVMKRYPDKGKAQPEWEEMCATACAVQNMQLMAASLNIACYWSSWDSSARESQAMRDYLRIAHPEDKCLGFLMVGQADDDVKLGYRSMRGEIRDKVTWIMD